MEVWSGIYLDVVQAIQHVSTEPTEAFGVWLAKDAARHRPLVRGIHLGRSGLGKRSVPAGLTGLRMIDVRECPSLAVDWLPENSAGNVEVLAPWGSSSIVRVPGHMTKLREIYVNECSSLAADWLPESSQNHPCLEIHAD